MNRMRLLVRNSVKTIEVSGGALLFVYVIYIFSIQGFGISDWSRTLCIEDLELLVLLVPLPKCCKKWSPAR